MPFNIVFCLYRKINGTCMLKGFYNMTRSWLKLLGSRAMIKLNLRVEMCVRCVYQCLMRHRRCLLSSAASAVDGCEKFLCAATSSDVASHLNSITAYNNDMTCAMTSPYLDWFSAVWATMEWNTKQTVIRLFRWHTVMVCIKYCVTPISFQSLLKCVACRCSRDRGWQPVPHPSCGNTKSSISDDGKTNWRNNKSVGGCWLQSSSCVKSWNWLLFVGEVRWCQTMETVIHK